VAIRECCDPAGASDTSHGTEGAVKILPAHGVHADFVADSNSPAVRLACVERIAAQMRKRAADGSEGLVINSDPERWRRISAELDVSDRFLAAGFQAGYVWDAHLVSVSNKSVRKPKKDGSYEHGQNCAEYLEVNFGMAPVKEKPKTPPATRGTPAGDGHAQTALYGPWPSVARERGERGGDVRQRHERHESRQQQQKHALNAPRVRASLFRCHQRAARRRVIPGVQRPPGRVEEPGTRQADRSRDTTAPHGDMRTADAHREARSRPREVDREARGESHPTVESESHGFQCSLSR
jgi:hypothetical protein